MLKIPILETPSHRRLVVEGKLIVPWTAELSCAWRKATAVHNGRELVIDVKGLTANSEDGESVLLELLTEGTRFRSAGVFTKWILKRLARKVRRDDHEAKR
jgi:hypothetical protein